MPAIPSITDFTGSGITEGEFKAALTGLHAYLVGAIGSAGTQSASLAALGAILGAGSVSKSGTYSVVAADRGKIIECTGTWTLTLPDASAVGNGFAVVVANVGGGNITLDPYASQTIDGQPTKIVPPRQTVICAAVSGQWITVSGGGAGLGLLRVTTFTASGTWVKPSDCRAIYVDVQGGGGAGGAGMPNHVDPEIGTYLGEGGSGGSEGNFVSVYTASPAGSYVVTVGGPGGTSSFGALASATGGSAGRAGGGRWVRSNGVLTSEGSGKNGGGRAGGQGGAPGAAGAAGGGFGAGGGGGGGGGGAGGAGASGFVRVFEFG